MSSSDLIRWGGIAGMLGGVLWAVWGLLIWVYLYAGGGSFSEGLFILVFLLAALLTLAGLVGLHVLQGGNYGRIGRAGFYTAAAALLAQALAEFFLLLGNEALQWLVFPVGSWAVLVGLVLYGAATLQARVLARWCGVGLIVVPSIAFFSLFYGGSALFGVLWVALGYVLWSQRGASAQRRPSRVR
jgi:hypothetical protein